MIHASICTIGNEILIGQVVDTNSSRIASALEEAGIRVTRMVSFGDDRDEILNNLRNELTQSDIVITTGGLGPTKDDMTKAVLAELSGSTGYVEHAGQLAIIHDILHSRGLDMLEINRAQALVPDRCEVIENRLGTAPVMVFRFPADSFNATLYALPGVPFEAVGAIPDIMQDIRAHYPLTNILHRSLMVYGLAESALSELIAPWEDALPDEMHLAYLPHPLTGIRLRLSIYGGTREDQEARVEEQIVRLKEILGNRVYSDQDDTLEATVGRLLKKAGMTLSAAESCTGGEISHLITSVPGSSAYYLGSVTSYAVSVKEKVLGVPAETIEKFGVVSSEVAAAMAEGVRKVTGSDYAISTTGLAGPDGDAFNPVGTVWIGVAGPNGVKTEKRHFRNDRKRNIQRFSAEALNILRLQILEDLSH
ncbi:MAG: CinA family nicotinamide mononucleotide deamidase-related protein [Bacteroidales bacterium]|jgi:nicotinamide-nucleotide amidase|nr:CinA family nicotinamide mononucleotide deamidase-related protein [Bacteroidales bacterium]